LVPCIIKIRAKINEMGTKRIIQNINKTELALWKDKIDKPLAKLTKAKWDNEIRDEQGDVTVDNTEIHRIIREYFENPYSKKLGLEKKWTNF
jgi:hypothetical protein